MQRENLRGLQPPPLVRRGVNATMLYQMSLQQRISVQCSPYIFFTNLLTGVCNGTSQIFLQSGKSYIGQLIVC